MPQVPPRIRGVRLPCVMEDTTAGPTTTMAATTRWQAAAKQRWRRTRQNAVATAARISANPVTGKHTRMIISATCHTGRPRSTPSPAAGPLGRRRSTMSPTRSPAAESPLPAQSGGCVNEACRYLLHDLSPFTTHIKSDGRTGGRLAADPSWVAVDNPSATYTRGCRNRRLPAEPAAGVPPPSWSRPRSDRE